jgi:glyoxylase-like metal-dependent hydrolase (beta-lactamase superfamily II)
MFGKIGEKIWKFTGSDKSNVYLIDGDKKILIDAGNRTDRDHLKMFMGKAVDFDKVDVVIFTHLHLDHSGNFDLFPNAEFYASAEEIEDFKKDPEGAVLDSVVAEKLGSIELKPLPEELFGLHVMPTPGHTRGSVCLWFEEEKAFFTGDTFFGTKRHGRVDLPTSAPDVMGDTMMKIVEIPYKLLCPGHDYE